MSEKRKYRPANGTEGMIFMENWCDWCKHNENEDCEILGKTFMYYEDDPDYPMQWIYDENDNPICTKFLRREK